MTDQKGLILRTLLIFIIQCFLLGACIINLSLLPQEEPLREQLIEGTGRPKILLIPVTGTIREDGRDSQVNLVKEMLQMALKDRDIEGIILRIDSPGGTVNASDIIYHEIKTLKEKKAIPVYAFIDGTGTSGAYYIAMAADRVYASPSSITGSIGVIAMKFNIENLMTKVGIQHEVVKSGDKKDFWSPFRPSTTEEKEIFQKIIDDLYERFLRVIYENRNGLLNMDEIRRLADGRIYTAGQALELKLIDRTGYIDQVIDELKLTRGLKEARVVRYYKPGTYRPTYYSGADTSGINLSLSVNEFTGLHPVRFMYLWLP